MPLSSAPLTANTLLSLPSFLLSFLSSPRYTQTRSSLPWDPKVEGQPAKMVDTYSQHHPPARMFNPILMKFTDSSVEKLKTKQENAMNVHRLNVAKDKQLCYEQKFDIISHKSHLPVTEKSLAETLRDRPKPLDSRVTYNIVSHHQKAAHPELSIIPLDETPRQERPRVHPAITAMGGGEGLLPRSHATRPFDVISNRYLEDHDKKVGKDLSNLRKEAQVRYWQTHNYDPVVGRYYDGEKEGEYARQVKALEEVHGSCQQARLPPSIQYSEGQAYNIVTMTCKDQDKLSTAVDNANRAVASKKGALIEQGIRKRAEDAADLAAERRLERIARTGVQRAQMDGRHHGYDPITNEKHHGRGSKPLAPSRLRAPDPVWVKLHNETTLSASNSGGVGGGMGMGTSVKPLAKARDLTGAPAAPSSSSSADPAVTVRIVLLPFPGRGPQISRGRMSTKST